MSASIETPPNGPAKTASEAAVPAPGRWWREMSRYHWWVVIVATLGWLFDGMDQRLFVLARTPALKDLLPGLTDAQITGYAGYATTIFIFGWATGGLIFGLLGDRIGRTRTMMITILIYAAFTGLSAFSVSWWDFAAYRFLCGIGIGGEYAAGIALVAEVVPDRARPYCLGLLQGLGALGHFGGSLLTLGIGPQSTINGIAGWRILFLVGILPALLVVLIRMGLKEPEKWVKAKEASKASSNPDELSKQVGDFRALFRDKRLRYHLIVGMLLGFAGQTGMWGIGYWTPELMRSAMLENRRAEIVVSNPALAGQALNTYNLDQLAQSATSDKTQAAELAKKWKNENDRIVARGTLLQDLFGMMGIYAFTWFTASVGRKKAFVLAYLMALGATLITFGKLQTISDINWMLPLLGFSVSSIYGGFAIYFPELFPTRLRSTGVGFCYNVARYITALGPLTLGKLTVLYAGLGYGMPLRQAAMTLSAVFLVGVATIYFAPETKGKPLPE